MIHKLTYWLEHKRYINVTRMHKLTHWLEHKSYINVIRIHKLTRWLEHKRYINLIRVHKPTHWLEHKHYINSIMIHKLTHWLEVHISGLISHMMITLNWNGLKTSMRWSLSHFFDLINCIYYILQDCYWVALKSQYIYFPRKGSEVLSNQPHDSVDIQNLICNTFL